MTEATLIANAAGGRCQRLSLRESEDWRILRVLRTRLPRAAAPATAAGWEVEWLNGDGISGCHLSAPAGAGPAPGARGRPTC